MAFRNKPLAVVLVALTVAQAAHAMLGADQPSVAAETEAATRIMIKWNGADSRAEAEPRLADMGLAFESDLMGDGMLVLYKVADGTPGADKAAAVRVQLAEFVQYVELDHVVTIQNPEGPAGGMGIGFADAPEEYDMELPPLDAVETAVDGQEVNAAGDASLG